MMDPFDVYKLYNALKLHFDNKLNKYLNIDEIFKRELDSTYNSSKFRI